MYSSLIFDDIINNWLLHILGDDSKDLIRFDRCAKCFLRLLQLPKTERWEGWTFWGRHAVVAESIVIQASWDAVWDQAHAESVQKGRKYGWQNHRPWKALTNMDYFALFSLGWRPYLSRKSQNEERIFMEKRVVAGNSALVIYDLQDMSIILRQVSILDKWLCVTFFTTKLGQFSMPKISLVCLHVNRQLVGRFKRLIFHGNFYLSLVRAYDFMNRILIIHPGTFCWRKYVNLETGHFLRGKTKILVPPNKWNLRKIYVLPENETITTELARRSASNFWNPFWSKNGFTSLIFAF